MKNAQGSYQRRVGEGRRRSGGGRDSRAPISHGKLSLFALAVVIWTLSANRPLSAQAPAMESPQFAPQANPEQDDATLHDVAFHGTQLGIAVGDHGAVWRTVDGGRRWEFRSSGVDAVLHAVCLFNEQLGWAAGSRIAPETRVGQGVLLQTTDGGRSWKRIDDGRLPALTTVHFTSPLKGCAAGVGSAQHPTGLLTTEDGGRTWQIAPGPRAAGWSAAAFLDGKNGVLIGRTGLLGTFGNGRLLPHRSPRSLKSWHDVKLFADGSGWLVGDGGAVRRTEDGGISWPESPAPLPREIADLHDLHAVAAQGTHVWAAGSPGSVVWHSPDAGATWEPQLTGDAAPIEALEFFTPLEGCAVGCFGAIRLTTDGGRTWRSVQGGARRPALLAIHGQATQASLPLVVRESGELGYRSVAWILARRDVGADEFLHRRSLDELRAEWLAAGGNEALLNWRLPLRTPDLSRESEQLIADWSQLHENQLRDVLLGGLVAAIRTWRPEVIVLDQAAPGDAVAALINEALPPAIEQAADPNCFPDQRRLGLAPWTVSKIFVRVGSGEPGPLVIDPFQVLPRLGTTLHHAASRAASCGPVPDQAAEQRDSFRLLRLAPGVDPMAADVMTSPLGRSFFAGLTLPAGGDARRRLPPITEVNDEQMLALARHQRNFTGYAERMLDDPVRAGQLIAQLRETVRPLPGDEAARLLADLADEYRRRSQWRYVEDTLVELVERDPLQPAARAALPWLIARWTSQEVLWQRLREISAASPSESLNTGVLRANFVQALQAVQESENSVQAEMRISALPNPLQSHARSGIVQVGGVETVLGSGGAQSGTNQWQIEITRRWGQARRAADLLQQTDPVLAAQPNVQFVLASLLRARQQAGDASEIYRSFFGVEEGSDPWHLTARGELWVDSRGALSPKPVIRCTRAAAPPLLDGELTDPCWSAASEASLRPPATGIDDDPTFVGSEQLTTDGRRIRRGPTAPEPAAIVLLAYDDRYLYAAASVPRSAAVPSAAIQLAGRRHDADLQTHDRLRFVFDVDRDYATYYAFEVDERGATRDALWEDQGWDPKWHVAAVGDPQHWRVEIAVPWEEITPTPPTRGTVWAGDLSRLIPTVGVRSWTQPASESIRPETFGLIQFD